MLRLILLALSVAAIAQIPAPNIVGGDVPSGASNLTTVGAIPYVSASGVLNQTANLSFDAANNRLVLGSATVQRFSTDLSLSRASAGVLQVGDGAANANGTVKAAGAVFSTTADGTSVDLNLSATGTGSDSAVNVLGSGAYIKLRSTLAGPYAGTQINKSSNTILWFTGTQGSDAYVWFTGSSFTSLASLTTGGTFSIYNQTPNYGVTKAVIRAGAGQSTTNLTEWQNASTGAVLSYFSADASLVLNSSGSGLTAPQVISSGNIRTGGNAKATSSGFFGWVSGADTSAALDTAIYRNAAGVLEINNGTAGTYRDILARRHQASGETVASLPAAAAGNAGTISYVTDANATTIGSTVAGGGANKVMVWSDGAAWKIFAN